MNRNYILIIGVAVLLGTSCRKPYSPTIVAANNNYLVVEGVINPGSDSTMIKLSRTVKLSSKTKTNPEIGAIVTLESDQNEVYTLAESGDGNYSAPGLNLDKSRTYRLRIQTGNNERYLSDFVPVKITPPIDSIGFTLDLVNNSVQIYANAHDPLNNTRYYRWDYEETWRFQAKYISMFITNFSAIVPRLPSQNITLCFAGDTSSDVVINNSAKLQHDIMYQSPIAQIPSTSEKIEMRYSILVRQYALTSEAYDFWDRLRKNTEQLGSIFDAQPSEITGNIHCISNPSLPAVGYVSICTVPSKRIFINKWQLPDNWLPTYPYNCELDTATGSTEYGILYNPDIDVVIGSTPHGYTYSSPQCVDCTIRGTKKQPAFW